MLIKTISERFQDMTIKEARELGDDYVEIVVSNDHMTEWDGLLRDCLGPPMKDADTQPTAEMQELTKEHGGIMKGQTIHRAQSEDDMVVAVLWPWGDGKHTTLKLFMSK